MVDDGIRRLDARIRSRPLTILWGILGLVTVKRSLVSQPALRSYIQLSSVRVPKSFLWIGINSVLQSQHNASGVRFRRSDDCRTQLSSLPLT